MNQNELDQDDSNKLNLQTNGLSNESKIALLSIASIVTIILLIYLFWKFKQHRQLKRYEQSSFRNVARISNPYEKFNNGRRMTIT